jgi:hypothetical protein
VRALLALVLALAAASAAAELRVRVVATDPPAAAATLGRFEPFYVRIQFDADEPVSLWARPYRNGKPVDRGARTNPSAKHTGSGYALGWVEFTEAAEVDEIRIRAGGGNPYREWVVASYPVKLAWTGQAPATRTHEPWVGELKRQADAAFKQAQREQASRPVSAGDTALMSGFMLAILGLLVGGLAAPAWAMWKWRGGWRGAAAVPAAIMAFVVLRIVVDTARDPTSHNLWPFELLMWGAASVAIVGVLALARRLLRATGA